MVEDKQFQYPESTDMNQKFYYRVDMTPPVLRAGWQTDQSANSKDLTFNYNPASFQSNPRVGPAASPPAAAHLFNEPAGTKGPTVGNDPLVVTPADTPYFGSYAGAVSGAASTGAAGSAIQITAPA
jgi:hypothetical protein